MTFDDKFFNELERRGKKATQNGRTEYVKKAEAARAHNAVKPEEFRGTGIVSDAQIDKDIAKADELEQKYDKPGFIASALELVVNEGIDSGSFFTPTEEGDTIESINTCKYDDYINRVDTAATIHRANGEDLTFALDLYTGDEPEKALGKIARSSNEPDSNIFAGFTEIRYYEDSKGKKRMRHIPRYCIGVDKESTFAAVDEVGNVENLFQTTSMTTVKFKMLYEMSQQNALYEDYLYEYQDDFEAQANGDNEFQEALHAIEELDSIYQRELERAKKALGPAYTKLSIDEIAKQFKSKDKTFKTIVEATEKLSKDKQEQESETIALRARKSGKRIVQAFQRLVPPKPSTS